MVNALRVRAVESVDEFFVPDDAADFQAFVTGAVEDGECHPDWCFVVEDDSEVVGRIGFTLTPSTSDAAWLGTLPPNELHSFGLRWSGQGEELDQLLRFALPRLAGAGPSHAAVAVNRRSTPHHDGVIAVLESLDAVLFQEKAGFELDAAGLSGTLPPGVGWSTVQDVGVDAYASMLARCGDGTFDRNDRYYWSHCGADNWGRQMMEYLDPDDADMWLVGHVDGAPIGYVFVTTDPLLVSTIGHIGVVPEARGRGHIRDLLDAAAASIARRGIPSMLSDVDVLNEPMLDAMRRAGHRDSDWHVWHYWCPLAGRGTSPVRTAGAPPTT